jgi:hypothetical protein
MDGLWRQHPSVLGSKMAENWWKVEGGPHEITVSLKRRHP